MRKPIILVTILLGSLVSAAEVTPVQVREGIYFLQGMGGNVGLSIGEDATFLIDDQYGEASQAIVDAVAILTDRPIDFVLNTHYHGDHTGGNTLMRSAGAWTIAHHNVGARVAADERQPASAIPVISYQESMRFGINGIELMVEHTSHAHTDGDSIVIFGGADVIHTGDVMFNGLFPFIDVDGGGNIDGVIRTMKAVLERMGPETVVMPGHGPLADRDAVVSYIAMLEDTRAMVLAAMEDGRTADQMVADGLLEAYTEDWTWGFINTERYTRSVVASLEGD
jgi:glyoxylase-like metal-dependent hydrolase (beta-lactamase superfamily II)